MQGIDSSAPLASVLQATFQLLWLRCRWVSRLSRALGLLESATDVGNTMADFLSLPRRYDGITYHGLAQFTANEACEDQQAVHIREQNIIPTESMVNYWKEAQQNYPERMSRKDTLTIANANIAAV